MDRLGPWSTLDEGEGNGEEELSKLDSSKVSNLENEDGQRKYKTRKKIIQFGPVEFEVPVGYSRGDCSGAQKKVQYDNYSMGTVEMAG